MMPFKKHPQKQLEKFTPIFIQLGLVLTLFVVFISLEYETEKKACQTFMLYDNSVETVFTFTQPIIEKKVVKKVKVQPKKQVIKTVLPPKVVLNDTKIIETALKPSVEEKPVINTSLHNKKATDNTKPLETAMSIKSVQNAPVFKGCEGLSEEKNRECFKRKVTQHVQRYFNVDLASSLGLASGKKRIYVQFKIDVDGTIIDINARAPHPRLKKEAERIAKKIPKMKPGEQNGRKVKVSYVLPVTFNVE